MSEERSNVEYTVEKNIKELTETAHRLIARQQGVEPEEPGRKSKSSPSSSLSCNLYLCAENRGDKSQIGSTSVTGANRF